MPRKTLGITRSAQGQAGVVEITCLSSCLGSQRGGSRGRLLSGCLVGATCILLSCLAESLLLPPKQSTYDKCHKQIAGTSAGIGVFKFRMP